MQDPDEFDLGSICQNTFVHNVDFHHELGSTNARAMELIKSECHVPTLVIAQRQTAGRGRGANRWWSAAGALTFSLVVDMEGIEVDRMGSLSLVVGLSICKALEELAPPLDVGLKWPNDVYLHRKKVCGILCESAIGKQRRVVIGIGLNVNNRLVDAPEEVRSRATSLRDALGDSLPITSVLEACLSQLDRGLTQMASQRGIDPEGWQSYCLLTGRCVTVETPSGMVVGQCLGIDPSGCLLVEQAGSQVVHRCIAGTVTAFSEARRLPL